MASALFISTAKASTHMIFVYYVLIIIDLKQDGGLYLEYKHNPLGKSRLFLM